jgi:hypothetical protein
VSAFSNKLYPAILFALLSISVVLFLVRGRRESFTSEESASVSSRISRELAAQFARFEAKEQQVAETVWAKEILAEKCGQVFDSLWDSLNAATNKLRLAGSFPFGQIVLAICPL